MKKMIVDLRSDTLTKPTPGMMEAMMAAQVGDDVFGEDPSINALQEKMAAMFGMEAALFVPSGTMANQIAIKVHTQPGDEVICDQLSHIYNYEGGGIAFNSGASVRLLQGERGVFSAKQVKDAILGPESYYAHSSLVVIENTVNKGGGSIWTLDKIKSIRELCLQNKLKLHLDGARLFNALVESGESTLDYGKTFDSISICLSKGLGTPVGSVLIGTKEDIHKAHRYRKVMGGGMRQAGFLAAAGIYALDHHIDRLKIDHENARKIAEKLRTISIIEEVLPVESNILIFRLKDENTAGAFLKTLNENGILAAPFGPTNIRFVTHLDISEQHMDYLLHFLENFGKA
jgi:threonine aldolase